MAETASTNESTLDQAKQTVADLASDATTTVKQLASGNGFTSSTPASTTFGSSGTRKVHLFGRTSSVHDILGSGPVADLLMWKKWKESALILGGSIIIWILFEKSGYTLLTLLANVAMILVTVLFGWAQVAGVLNRAPPRLPELELSEDLVQNTARVVRIEVNKALAVTHDIALGKDFRQFAKVLCGFFLLSYVGSWFNFLTLLLIVIILAFTVPYVYEKYEDLFDEHGQVALDKAGSAYKVVQDKVLSKFPKAAPKEKKVQ